MIWIWSYEQWTWTKAIKEKIKFILHVQAHPDDNRNNNKRKQERSGRLIYLIYKGEEIIINPRRLVIETHATKNHNKQARKM